MADSSTVTGGVSAIGAKNTAAEPRRSWADEEDEAAQKPNALASSSREQTTSELKLESLSILDTEKGIESLDDPDGSNIQTVTVQDTPYISAKKFEDLQLSEELLKGLYLEMKFERPSKIQAVSLPMILNPPYLSLVAQAHNGSGKTTCFVLGMLSRVDPKFNVPQALCICPTRELAIQNIAVLNKMAKYTGISSKCAVPMDGSPIAHQQPWTEQVVIGTPGTIKNLVSRKKLSVSFMKIVVFDEADHMLAQDGFKDDSLRILNYIRKANTNLQVLLFSATFNDTVKKFIPAVVDKYNQIFVKKEELSLQAVKQYKVQCPDELSKIIVIKDRIFELGDKLGQTIIFVKSRNSASILHKALARYGYTVTTIQGALTQDDRDKIVKEFRDGATKVLISTDLLARGFDQSEVNLVINYDLPLKHDIPSEPDYELYLHRVGRAGRFGTKGVAFNLLCYENDDMIMEKIEKHFDIKVKEVPSFQSDEDFEVALKEAGLL